MRPRIEFATGAQHDLRRHSGAFGFVGRRLVLLRLRHLLGPRGGLTQGRVRHLYGPWFHLPDGRYSFVMRQLQEAEMRMLQATEPLGFFVARILTAVEIAVLIEEEIVEGDG